MEELIAAAAEAIGVYKAVQGRSQSSVLCTWVQYHQLEKGNLLVMSKEKGSHRVHEGEKAIP